MKYYLGLRSIEEEFSGMILDRSSLKKSKGLTMASNHDFFSCLPDETLVAIISKLQADEAIRTGILSKRWKDLWTHVSHLNFVPNRKGISSEDQNIDRVLFRHDREYNLIGCKIIHHPDGCVNGDLEKWIKLLVSEKKVRGLAFHCDNAQKPFHPQIHWNLPSTGIFHPPPIPWNLPSGIFSCETLQELELTCYNIQSDSPFNQCHNLKTLKIKSCVIYAGTLEGIVSCCDYLEHLSVCSCNTELQVRIISQSIKTVELKSMRLNYIYLSSESLCVLAFESLRFPAKRLDLHAPNLKVFRATGVGDTRIADILEHCSGILEPFNPDDDPIVEPEPNMFTNLRELSIDLDFNNIRETLILSFVLQHCLVLQQLEINIQKSRTEMNGASFDRDTENSSLSYPESKLWEERELCDCIAFTLKQVSIKRFEGKQRELEFVSYLIRRGAKMKKIEIWCNNDRWRNELKATLDSLPKSSIDLCIKPGTRT